MILQPVHVNRLTRRVLASLFAASLASLLLASCQVHYPDGFPSPSGRNEGKALSTGAPSTTRVKDASSPLPPAPTPLASPAPASSARAPVAANLAPASTGIEITSSTLTFDAYPFERYLQPRQDPYNRFLFNALDRPAYEQSAGSQPTAGKTVRTIILENEFLRLVLLPELGGRLFQMTFKPTNQPLLYNNRVLKPTSWGPPDQGGWLSVGGMEWAFPVNEHGYEWATPWLVETRRDSRGGTLTVTDSKNTSNIRVTIDITLPAHAAFILVHPRIQNISSGPVRMQFWINAQVALSKQRVVSPNTEFILPTPSVYVHATGNHFIPTSYVPRDGASSPAAPMPWAAIAGHDLRRYQNWDDYLGVFASNPTGPYMGAYDHDSQIGIARVFPPDQVPGVKLFAFGPNFCCRSQFADDGSDYFELWGGLPRTFFSDDDITLAPGQTREWDEFWLPFVQTGGLSAAANDAVINLNAQAGTTFVGAYSAIRREANLVLSKGEKEIMRWHVTLSPTDPFRENVIAETGDLRLQLLDSQGHLILSTSQ